MSFGLALQDHIFVTDIYEVRHLINIAIVDDEQYIREDIKKWIEQTGDDLAADGFESGEAFLNAEKQYDIVFLDIQLGGMDGIHVAKRLRQKAENAILIFVTGTKEYVFQAFDVAAFHYLLKPIRQEKFEEVLTRAAEEIKKRKKDEAGLLLIRTRNRTFPVQKSSILYVESRGKKAEIHTGRETITMYASLNSLQAELGEGFYRSHRGYLLNMAYVSEYYHDSILLTNGEAIYLARDKYQEFVKEYMRYLKSGGIIHG